MPTRDTAPEQSGAVAVSAERKRAVIYLRVSTPSQVKTDYDPEGLSIPAQRRACERKATQLGADIVSEYVEPGQSATTMDRRVAFQEMLERIRRQRDVDYVIVYKLSRMNRNWVDGAIVLGQLRKHGVILASATENVDETPTGQAMFGMIAVMNGFRSAEDGEDIKYKMGEKARRGGTLGRAPLGYQNVRDRFEGRDIGTVIIDEERAPFIKLAFELYATGHYTVDHLADELSGRGLSTRPGRHPAGPISPNKVHQMLRDRYYLGYITYRGEEFPGRHESLITPELFEKVQQVMALRSGAGTRQRRHHHYLKGMLWCGVCREAERESRLIIQRSTGRRGGQYDYFFCRGKQEHVCDGPYLAMEAVEDAIVVDYGRLKVLPEFIEFVRTKVREVADQEDQSVRLLRKQLSTELDRLDRKEERLLDLVSDGEVSSEKARERLVAIKDERVRLRRELKDAQSGLAEAVELIEAALELLDDPEELYRRLDDRGRKMLNQAIFEKFYVNDEGVIEHVLRPPFDELIPARDQFRSTPLVREDAMAGSKLSMTPLLATGLFLVGGSSKGVMVEVSGLESPTSTLRKSIRRTAADCAGPSRQVSELSIRRRTATYGGVRGMVAG